MATMVALEEAVAAKIGLETAGRGGAPLTDWQRRKILIVAAATAALGAPVRIVDIRTVQARTKWGKADRLRRESPRIGAWQRRSFTQPAGSGEVEEGAES